MANASISNKPREQRHNFHGVVRLSLDFPPLKLMLTGKGKNVSKSGALLQLTSEQLGSHLTLADVKDMCSVGKSVHCQLECPEIDLPVVNLRALVARIQSLHPTVLDVGVTFDEDSEDLKSLIHEISET